MALWLSSAVLLSFGLTRPVIQISVNVEGVLQDALDRQPVIGLLLQERGLKIADIAAKLPPTSVTRQSILSSTTKLFHLKCYAAAMLILIFSIVVPIIKQVVLLLIVLLPDDRSQTLRSATEAVHKWAMLDVFVLSTVVLALSSASAWNAILLDGFYWFIGYFLSVGALGILLSRRSKSVRVATSKNQPNELSKV